MFNKAIFQLPLSFILNDCVAGIYVHGLREKIDLLSYENNS